MLPLHVNDLVKICLLILMIRTYYYLIGTYFYYLLLGPCGGMVFSTSFDQFFDWFCQYFDGSELYYKVMSGDL